MSKKASNPPPPELAVRYRDHQHSKRATLAETQAWSRGYTQGRKQGRQDLVDGINVGDLIHYIHDVRLENGFEAAVAYLTEVLRSMCIENND